MVRFSNDVLVLFSQTEEESKKKVVVAAVVTMGIVTTGVEATYIIASTQRQPFGWFPWNFFWDFRVFFNWPSPLRYGEGSSLKVSVDTSRFAAVNVKIDMYFCAYPRQFCDIDLC